MDSEEITDTDTCAQLLKGVNGILVPGGFGTRGTEGKILAVRYARENKIPFLGICLGMQMAIVEFARHVLGYHDANSIELDPNTMHPVIALMPEQDGIEDIGGTLRLGAYPCILADGTKARELYGTKEISERHRHRYEVNNDYREKLQEAGMTLAGLSPDGRIVEMIELKEHPFFIGTQGHPNLNPVRTMHIRCSAALSLLLRRIKRTWRNSRNAGSPHRRSFKKKGCVIYESKRTPARFISSAV